MCGQTYSRKVDVDCLTSLASLGATVHKASLKKNFCLKECAFIKEKVL